MNMPEATDRRDSPPCRIVTRRFGPIRSPLNFAASRVRNISSSAHARRNVLQAIEAVARMLGNSPAICRRCYGHPVVLDSYLDGTLVDQLKRRAEHTLANELKTLRPEEATVRVLLRQALSKRGRHVFSRVCSPGLPRTSLVSAGLGRRLPHPRKPRQTARHGRASSCKRR